MPYKEKARQRVEQSRLRNIAKTRKTAYLLEVKAQGCVNCGETAPECLDFHHLDSQTKEGGISVMRNNGTSLERLQAEVAKCYVVCANCHRKLHAGTLILGCSSMR